MAACYGLLLLLLVLVLVCLAHGMSANEAPYVDGMACGASITGVWTTAVDRSTNLSRHVASFRGIPFAEKPVRFSPPVPARCANRTINGTYFRPLCAQLTLGLVNNVTLIGSEDCLFLQVRVPARVYHRRPTAPLAPVLVYIPGGSFVFGGGPEENLDYLAAFAGLEAGSPGMVVVTLNYRLSLLGFLGAAAVPLNLGIRDQIVALQWVQRNIAAFGGDPAQVTICGQSSGGTSVYALLSSPHTRGLFRAAMGLSASPNITIDAAAKVQQDLPVLAALGCGGGSVAQQLACLRALPLEAIFRAVPPDWNWNTPGAMSLNHLHRSGRHFSGILCVDGDVVAMPFEAAVRSGLHRNVSVMLTNTGQEGNMELEPVDLALAPTPAALEALFRTLFSDWGVNGSVEVAAALLAGYQAEAAVSSILAYYSVQTDFSVSCANSALAKLHAQPPSFFTGPEGPHAAPWYVAVVQWPPALPGPGPLGQLGHWMQAAYHLWDWTMATQQFPLMGFIPYHPQPEDYALGRMLRQQYFQFIAAPDAMDQLSPPWHPAVAFGAATVNTFVHARPDRFPFHLSGTVASYKDAECATLREVGFNESFWWCN